MRADPSNKLRKLLFAAVTAPVIVSCGGQTGHTGTGNNSAGGASGAGGTGGAAGSVIAGSSGSGGSSGSAGSSGIGGIAGASGTGGSSGSGGTGATGPKQCETDTAVLVDGHETGMYSCDGLLHRKFALECYSKIPRPEACVGGEFDSCKQDSDCIDAPNGYCSIVSDFGANYCNCYYGCTNDSQCPDGTFCQCGDPVGTCVSSYCLSDKECGDYLCAKSESPYDPPCNSTVFACQTAQDTCTTTADCPDLSTCAFNGEKRDCAEQQPCGVGRPLTINGIIVLSSLNSDESWS